MKNTKEAINLLRELKEYYDKDNITTLLYKEESTILREQADRLDYKKDLDIRINKFFYTIDNKDI